MGGRKRVGAVCGRSLVLILAACNPDDVTQTPFATRRGPMPILIASTPPAVRVEEADFAELASIAPSSAGFVLDSLDNIVVFVRDSMDAATVRRGVDALSAAGRIRRHLRGTPQVILRHADFSFSELAAARDVIFDSVFTQMPGMSSLDLDEARNRVTIGLDQRSYGATRASIARRAVSLGIDTTLLWFRQQAPLRTRSVSSFLRASMLFNGDQLTATFDSLIGGVTVRTDHAAAQGGGPGDCTIGFTAYYNGYRAFVTATHCTTVWGAPDNTIASQAIARRVGVEAIDPNKYHCGLNWCRASDASLFRIDDSIPSIRGVIARTTYRNSGGGNGGSGSRYIDLLHPAFTVTGAGTSLVVGMELQRIGRTSGWVFGNITNTCVDHHYDGDETGFLTVYTMVCGYQAAMENLGGDSGGPLFRWTGGDSVTLEGTVVGDLTTQDEVFSKFSRIASDFGGTLIVGRNAPLPTLSVMLSGPTTVRTNQATCAWTAQASGGILPYSYAWKKNGVAVGSNSPFLQLSSTGTSSFVLSIDVTDGENSTRSANMSVAVGASAPACQL